MSRPRNVGKAMALIGDICVEMSSEMSDAETEDLILAIPPDDRREMIRGFTEDLGSAGVLHSVLRGEKSVVAPGIDSARTNKLLRSMATVARILDPSSLSSVKQPKLSWVGELEFRLMPITVLTHIDLLPGAVHSNNLDSVQQWEAVWFWQEMSRWRGLMPKKDVVIHVTGEPRCWFLLKKHPSMQAIFRGNKENPDGLGYVGAVNPRYRLDYCLGMARRS
jgi:hypothetical protein